MFEQLEMCSDHQETSSFSITDEKIGGYMYIKVDVGMLKILKDG